MLDALLERGWVRNAGEFSKGSPLSFADQWLILKKDIVKVLKPSLIRRTFDSKCCVIGIQV